MSVKGVIGAVFKGASEQASRDRSFDESALAKATELCGNMNIETLCSSLETSAEYDLSDFQPLLDISEDIDNGEIAFNDAEIQEAADSLSGSIDELWYALQELVLPSRSGDRYTFDPAKVDSEISESLAEKFSLNLSNVCSLCNSVRVNYKDFRSICREILGS